MCVCVCVCVGTTELMVLVQDFLQREFGVKTGDMLWSYARGTDIREVRPAQVHMHFCRFPYHKFFQRICICTKISDNATGCDMNIFCQIHRRGVTFLITFLLSLFSFIL